ncbi:MAG TPA: phosphate ABC transporter permease subunit PstC [Candidatus Limnocylindrales bacterium]|nr:phosphate ABC transporter permease subunit PstC [Candidatus Limnocylindrales bacterium]
MSNRLNFEKLLKGLKHPSSDVFFKYGSLVFAASVIGVIALSMVVLVRGAFPALTSFGFRFLTGVNWDAAAGFGALPYILGTLVTASIAIIIGVPISLGIAIFLAEMAPDVIKVAVSNIIELLAAVPSIIYGLWGLYVLRVWVANYVQSPVQNSFGFLPIFSGTSYGLNFLTAGLILAIMIIPTVASISREVMVSVPISQREAAYSVGATRWEVVRISVLSYARSGIFGAAVLGLGRAVGETMAVTMVIGGATGASALPTSLFKPGQTMATILVNQLSEAESGSLQLAALLGIGLVLFAIAFAINIVAHLLVWRVLKVQAGAVE